MDDNPGGATIPARDRKKIKKVLSRRRRQAAVSFSINECYINVIWPHVRYASIRPFRASVENDANVP